MELCVRERKKGNKYCLSINLIADFCPHLGIFGYSHYISARGEIWPKRSEKKNKNKNNTKMRTKVRNEINTKIKKPHLKKDSQ